MAEEKIILGQKADQKIKCSKCGSTLPSSDAYRFKSGKQIVYICEDCRLLVNKEYETELIDPNLVGGLLGGLAGGLLGGLGWYLFVVLTKFELGYIAIGVGYLVAHGVYLGSGKKRGISLQFIALGETFLALLASNYFVFSQLSLAAAARANGAESAGILSTNVLEAAILLLDRLDIFINYILSPISILIWVIAAYVSFSYLRPRKI